MSYDLSRIDFSKADGGEAARFEVSLPAGNGSGAAPQVITATQDPDKYLVSCVDDYDSGLVTLLLQRNDKGEITGYEANALDLKQPYKAIQEDRLNIQRAQSAVLVERDGVQYAIVSDDNYAFNDAYWKAQFEAPMFVSTGFGPPTAMGGGMTALPVKVGGKLGIIKDPFGEAVFLGATDPLDGQGIVNLSVSEDGKVLIGQLKGGYGSPVVIAKSSISGTTIDFEPASVQKEHANVAWDVDALINAAMANDGLSENQRLTYGLEVGNYVLPSAKPEGSNYTAAPAGTFFDPSFSDIKMNNERVGDIVTVDMKRQIAHSLLKLPLPGTFAITPATQQAVNNLMAKMTDFRILGLDEQLFTEADAPKDPKKDGMKVLRNSDNSILTKADGEKDIFNETGLLYLEPYLDETDMNNLRDGHYASQKSMKFVVAYQLGEVGNGQLIEGITQGWSSASIEVVASDAEHENFFGDRDPEDPGYSAFTLTGSVGIGETNNLLDVYRVEQRLKYLGYPAFDVGNAVAADGNPSNLDALEFEVDGDFDVKEESALRAFFAATQYKRYQNEQIGDEELDANDKDISSGEYGMRSTNNNDSAKEVTQSSNILKWLNAYNAPHLINIYKSLGMDPIEQGHTWGAFKDGTSVTFEIYGTSWARDLLKAWELLRSKQKVTVASVNADGTPSTQQVVFNSGVGQLNGLTDPNYGFLGHSAGGHSIGTGIDWGFTPTYVKDNENLSASEAFFRISQQVEHGTLTLNGSTATYTRTPGYTGVDTFKYRAGAGAEEYTYEIAAGTSSPIALDLVAHLRGKLGIATGVWSLDNAYKWSSVLSGVRDNNQRDALRNFLSLYAVTREVSGENGDWGDIKLKYATDAAYKKSLFGSGAGDVAQLLQNVWIGGEGADQNPWSQINFVLDQLFANESGFNQAQEEDHHNHFHADLRPTENAVAIKNGGSSLLASSIVDQQSATSDFDLQAAAQNLFSNIQRELGFTGETIMWIPDFSDAPVQQAEVVMVAEASTSSASAPAATMQTASTVQAEHVLGVCQLIANPINDQKNPSWISPYYAAHSYIRDYLGNKDVNSSQIRTISKVTAVQLPTHGSFITVTDENEIEIWGQDTGDGIGYAYIPDINYTGEDKLTVQVDVEGYGSIKVMYFLHVLDRGGDFSDAQYREWFAEQPSRDPCDNGGVTKKWKISSTEFTPTIQVADLANGALASTSGTTITLDDNAAGNNWYVDNNWLDNSEWLPTSNPNEWKAREGSDAYGKMDLLSVMLHEYGHVLGIEHSANAQNFMSTTLTAGTRRLPSPEEMQLMANLVAGVKDSLPSDPGIPLPSIPLALGALAFARRREDGDVGAGLVPAQEGYPQGVPLQEVHYTVDYQVASNSELQGLESPNKWLVTGNVNFAGNSATLGEASRTQTRLNQIFVVNPGDTTFSFTINKALTDQAGPDDAFEVALLDASTGANLLGGIGLTHSDAFLNIQGSGVERRASQVTRSVNADGSVTYMVDISAIAAGTTVNLSFDMIGFTPMDGAYAGNLSGTSPAANSTVTISQVQMGAILAIAANDSVMATEDQAIHFNALSNDLHTQGYSPLIVVAPQHGVVTINADGSFSYVPDANYSGEDSFSMRYVSKEISDHFLCKACGISTVTYLKDQGNVVGVSVNIACLDGVDTTQMKPLMVDGRSF